MEPIMIVMFMYGIEMTFRTSLYGCKECYAELPQSISGSEIGRRLPLFGSNQDSFLHLHAVK